MTSRTPRTIAHLAINVAVNMAIVGVLIGTLTTTASAASKTITDVRSWTAGDVTRVAIEVSGPFTYKAARLEAENGLPVRVFYDIADAEPGMVDKGQHEITVGDGLLKKIRVGENRPGLTRIVLELENGVGTIDSQLSNPARLVVELRLPADRQRTISSTPATPAAPKPTTAPPVATPQSPAPVTRPQQAETVLASTTVPNSSTPENVPAAKPAVPATVTSTLPAPIATVPQRDANELEGPRLAARNSNGDRSLTRVLGLKVGRVVIDAGHGGHDPGTHGKSGVVEKDISLDIAKRLAHILQERGGSEVILTRTDDTYVGLEQRTKIANDSKADLFLSIHVNSSPLKSVAGIDTYFLNFNASREDLDLAMSENATADSTIFDLSEKVKNIALRAKIDESRELAIRLQRSLHKMAQAQNNAARDRAVKRAPFVVLIGAEMPSVLAEVGFLSNDRDEELLRNPQHRERIAEALFDGLESYVASLSDSKLAQVEE